MSFAPEPYTDFASSLRAAVVSLLWIIGLVILAIALTTVVGCESTPQVEAVHFAGEGSLEVVTDQGTAGGVITAHVYSDGEDDTYACPYIELDVVWETSVGTVDVHAEGVPPYTEEAPIDPRCYENLPPFGLRPRPAK